MSTRRLLIVEDQTVTYTGLKEHFEKAGWAVERAGDAESAIYAVGRAAGSGSPFDLVLVDLGLPPVINDPFRGGLPLIDRLREDWSDLPIAAYSALTSREFDYARALKALLVRRVSFLPTRVTPVPELLSAAELASLGYCVVPGAAAGYLEKAIADRPDPLDEKDWQILKGLSKGLSDSKIAEGMEDLQQDAVRKRIRKIRDTLVDSNWLPENQTDRSQLGQWYRDHHVRFSRT